MTPIDEGAWAASRVSSDGAARAGAAPRTTPAISVPHADGVATGPSSALPEQLRARWRRACVQHPDAAAFAEECLDDWNSHLRGCAESDADDE